MVAVGLELLVAEVEVGMMILVLGVAGVADMDTVGEVVVVEGQVVEHAEEDNVVRNSAG